THDPGGAGRPPPGSEDDRSRRAVAQAVAAQPSGGPLSPASGLSDRPGEPWARRGARRTELSIAHRGGRRALDRRGRRVPARRASGAHRGRGDRPEAPSLLAAGRCGGRGGGGACRRSWYPVRHGPLPHGRPSATARGVMRRLLAITVILTFAAMPAGLAQHREGKVLLSGYLGLATRTSLWSIDRQPLSSLFAASRSQPSDTVHLSRSIAARLVPHATLRPFVRVGAGAVHYGESTVAVEGTLLRPSPVRDPSPKHTSVALVIAGGVGRSAGAGREILLEVRDVLTSL